MEYEKIDLYNYLVDGGYEHSAKRVVASFFACEGIDTEELENLKEGELDKALSEYDRDLHRKRFFALCPECKSDYLVGSKFTTWEKITAIDDGTPLYWDKKEMISACDELKGYIKHSGYYDRAIEQDMNLSCSCCNWKGEAKDVLIEETTKMEVIENGLSHIFGKCEKEKKS